MGDCIFKQKWYELFEDAEYGKLSRYETQNTYSVLRHYIRIAGVVA
jgi:hypothetical protein